MSFYADLHIHSKYSRACSKDCELEHLAWWARRKGLSVVGTGDFTHPAWFEHLRETLEPAEPGLFRLRPDVAKEIARRLPASCQGPVRFMLSVEIATIYKRAERTRKVHHLIYVPSFTAADALTRELTKVGNLASDGRPILGLDSRDLLELTLASDPGSYLVPAHIWTPWFSALGSKSGFDTVADCYGDLADHIFAVETGLSSDPPMNYRLATLDRYRLVSNSDAHSPPMLGREATRFDTELDYFAMRDALRNGAGGIQTVEFFPEEGKYHLDGHRKCGLRLRPARTREYGDQRCPSCGKPLTVGVLHRVEELADRPEGFQPPDADPFHNLVPLPEIVGEIRGVGPKTKTVHRDLSSLVAELGPELTILREAPLDEVARAGSALLAEGIQRLRQGEVIRQPGYDGEYGTISLFEPAEIQRRLSVPALFEVDERMRQRTTDEAQAQESVRPRQPDVLEPFEETPPLPPGDAATEISLDGSLLGGLDPDQRAAASQIDVPLLIVAGPGTGKTRTLTHRIAYLVMECGIPPDRCLAITFTRRACAEMRERLSDLIGPQARSVTVSTFHGLGASILRAEHERAGLPTNFRIADEAERLAVAEELGGSPQEARRLLEELEGDRASAVESRARFEKALRARGLIDFYDLAALPAEMLAAHSEVAARYRERYRWVCVDEYQDVDERQYQLLRLLCPSEGDQANLCAIGDPDQAIYGFRGANVGFFLRFREDYPQARTAALTRNYRSSPVIIDGAVQAIRPTTLVPGRELRPARAEPGAARIGVHAAPDEEAEATSVVTTIDQLLGGSSFHSLDSGRVDADGDGRLSFSDIAVLYRTDAASRPVTEALTRAGMPFQKRSHDRLASRPGVADIVRELRYLGDMRLHEAADAAITSLPAAAGEERAPEIRAAAELLQPLARRCGGELQPFLSELMLGAEVDAWDPRADRVSLLTIHAAKGLEFPVVLLVGCENGLLPLRWPGDPHGTDQEEERRLFFVGITRAQSHLYLSHAASRTSFGRRLEAAPSPFLSAMDGALLEHSGGERRRRQRDRQLRLM